MYNKSYLIVQFFGLSNVNFGIDAYKIEDRFW